MFNLLIVDDEWTIREGLEKTIPWKKWQIATVGTAKNGEEAIKYLSENHVDILLTDIRMPGMDGLKLIKKVKKTNSTMKIVILTGYNEFDYAQKAVKLGANDFLLKPTNYNELESTMGTLIKEMVEQQKEDYRMMSLLLKNVIHYPTKENLLKLKSLDLIRPKFGVMIINTATDPLVAQDLQNCVLIDHSNNEHIYLFHSIQDEDHWNELSIEIYNKPIQDEITFSLSSLGDLNSLYSLYSQAKIASVLSFVNNHTKVFRYEENNYDLDIQSALSYINKHIYNSISLTDIAAKHHVSNSYFSRLFKQSTGMNFVDYITDKRLKKAKKLLTSTELKTYEVATKVGYSEPRYFSQLFKRRTGLTPSEYRVKYGSE